MTQITAQAVDAAIQSLSAEKTYKSVGYGIDAKGRGAVRYTNDPAARRTRTLVRSGFTGVKFVDLPRAMTKQDIDTSQFVIVVTPDSQCAQTQAVGL